MNIVKEFPPNIDKISLLFKVDKDVVFCYGDKICNPYDIKLKDHVVLHESVHSEQQKAMGGPETWWDKYLENKEFRIAQEAEAYGAQLKFIRAHYGVEAAMQSLHSFANYLSSDVYGNAINYEGAREQIRKWAYEINKKSYL